MICGYVIFAAMTGMNHSSASWWMCTPSASLQTMFQPGKERCRHEGRHLWIGVLPLNIQRRLGQDSLITVLFLAANPSDSTRLCLDEEQREIDLALRSSEHRNRFDLRSHGAVRPKDLQHLLLRYRPTIVHLSGHGSSASEILLQDDYGVSVPVQPDALRRLFQVLGDNIRCVVLNACYTESQAEAISDHVDCVIGMSSLISDQTAIRFASSFYQALGFGRDVKTAFDLGCNQVALAGIPEEDSPRLMANRVDPTLVRFVP